MNWYVIGQIVFWLLAIAMVITIYFMPEKLPKTDLIVHSKTFDTKKRLVMESKCKEILENRFQEPFNKCRPSFLYNPETGKNLELDGFNQKLKIAFEYNGSQHYFYNPYYHKTKDDFEKQKKRDELKKQLCIKHGIHLIVIPYELRAEELEKYIMDDLSTMRSEKIDT